METPNPNAVLRRKASAAKEVWQARSMSPAKALRLSLARTAEDLWDLALAASGIALSEDGLDAVIDSLPEDGLIALLDGPEGAIGAAYFQFPVVAGLVEVQTIGKVSKLTPDPRPVTRTDAAMVAPLIDGAMERFEALLEESGGGDAGWACGYRFGSMMDSVRMLSLALRATDFHVFRITLDLAAEREGEAMLIFPVVDLPDAAVPTDTRFNEEAISSSVMQAPADLQAVLHRISLTLSAISALKPGDTLPIPREAIDKTELQVGDQCVRVKSRLGQVNGMRAVRLAMPGIGAAVAGSLAAATSAADKGAAEPAMDLGAMAMADAPDLPDLPDLPDVDASAEDEPTFEVPSLEDDNLLGDLPDLGDLPGLDLGGLGEDDGEESGLPDLPPLGSLPMASLPDID